jgi:inner membrane protein
MADEIRKARSPGFKLLMAALIGLVLVIPLVLVYALVYDRQSQSETAQTAINAGWGGPQVVAGPIVVVPFKTTQTRTRRSTARRSPASSRSRSCSTSRPPIIG